MSDIFLTATRRGLRFPSIVGQLTTEDLWSLPLTTTRPNKASLENIGNALLKRQAELEAGSILVDSGTSPEKATVDLQVAILRKVVEVRKAENAERLDAANKASERQRLAEAIARRELNETPVEELKKRLDALSK